MFLPENVEKHPLRLLTNNIRSLPCSKGQNRIKALSRREFPPSTRQSACQWPHKIGAYPGVCACLPRCDKATRDIARHVAVLKHANTSAVTSSYTQLKNHLRKKDVHYLHAPPHPAAFEDTPLYVGLSKASYKTSHFVSVARLLPPLAAVPALPSPSARDLSLQIPTALGLNGTKKEKRQLLLFSVVAGVGFEPHDLRVMSPTSYRTALPRTIII